MSRKPSPPAPDQPERDRILRELDRNLFVEAGAGSGKTQSMVLRMVELVRTGTATVDQIAAVTFTRKAAAELRERFQEELEAAYRATFSKGDAADRPRLQAALAGLDRCFVGTIHAFCARLLRERPLSAGVPPDFEELSAAEEVQARAEAWSRFIDRVHARKRSRLLEALGKLGLKPAQLRYAFDAISGNPDVVFPAQSTGDLNAAARQRVGAQLEKLLRESAARLPDAEPAAGWDGLQSSIRSLRFTRQFPGWAEESGFFAGLAIAMEGSTDITQNRWEKGVAKEVAAAWTAFREENGEPARLYAWWLARRYRAVIRFARAAAAHYAAERRQAGRLTFEDLLLRSVELLRSDPQARRELGLRYRRVLVDEFQDTDPIQAELVFLLASEGPEVDWGRVALRPGALFLVGDPKQSIYRFRRADISLYLQVKERIGRQNVVRLTANFRSVRPVGELVNAVFPHYLPIDDGEVQAAFARLDTVKGPEEGGAVRWYRIKPAGPGNQNTGRRISQPDARAVASLIAQRVSTDRTHRPGDFLVLTRSKGELGVYARELERRGIPVQVSGSRADVAGELDDLLLVLRALADPTDPVPTLACLEGLFFGCSHVDLYEHVRAGGRFSLVAPAQPAGRAGEALLKLREWWTLARSAPVDVILDRVLEDMTLLPYLAAAELGSARAGVIVYLQEVLRRATAQGPVSLPRAIELLEQALAEEVEAPLIPAAGDVVRVMNLHKAKGLEAPVVILAYPNAERAHAVWRHVRRPPGCPAEGWLQVPDVSRRGADIVARPLDWATHEQAEQEFEAAEKVRLLYVAATRARGELIVARCDETAGRCPWSLLHPGLDDAALAAELVIEAGDPPPAPELTAADLADVPARVAELVARREQLKTPSYRSAPVTARVKGGAQVYGAAVGRGAEWGSVVHQALEASARGVAGAELRACCRDLLIAQERDLDARGEPVELDEVVALVERVQRSSLWARALAAPVRLMEVPFRVAFPPAETPVLALAGAAPAPLELVEGVVDLAFREPGKGWVICDYKTDLASAQDDASGRLPIYQRQVDLYATCWERVTGETVAERMLLLLGGAEPQPFSWTAPATNA